MRIGIQDWRVIEAFVDGRAKEGHKLRTDGHRLDGIWMGGANIASKGHDNYTIRFHDLGSRAAQTVQRAVRGMAPAMQMADGKGPMAGRVQYGSRVRRRR